MVKIRPRQKPFKKGESKAKYQYDRQQRLAQIQLDEANAAAQRAEANRAGAERANRNAGVVMQAMSQQSNETPFTAQEYQEAGESLRQEKVQKWNDINKGLEAAFMAQLGTDLAVPLLRMGLNFARNKAISPAAKAMMNPENFVFDGPNIKPVQMNVPTIEQAMNSSVTPEGGSLALTLFRKPMLRLPQQKQPLGLPLRNATAKLNTPAEYAGLYDLTDGDLFGIKLVDTALRPRATVSPHSLPVGFMEHHTGSSADRVIDNIYSNWNQMRPYWEMDGIKPPLPFVSSVGDDGVSIGFIPQWYKMISTPKNLERMTSFAGPTKNKLIANLSPEAKTAMDARNMAPVDLFDEWLGPEARSPRQIAIDNEIDAVNKSLQDRLLFDSDVNSLYSNKLITPKHKAALLNSDEPLKYFGNAVLHNIMKKAVQNYFKDIKTVKQKDYARRVMVARDLEDMINSSLNNAADTAYRDLQGSILPPTSLNKLIADTNRTVGQIRSIGDIVENTFNNYQAWKADPNRAGWQLKYLMKGNKLERQLSKDGNVSVNAINDQVKGASDIEKYVTDKVLKEQFAGQTKVNYVDFKHAVQNELVSYNKTPTTHYLDYGLHRIGYDPGSVKLKTYTFNSDRIKEGNPRHYDQNTLGHSRTFVSNEEPDVMHVMESQSDWGQAKLDGLTKNDAHGKYLHTNWESRQIQENMIEASRNGLTKMRYPTEETAVKIEGYLKNAYIEEYQKLLDERDVLIYRNSHILDTTGKEDPNLRKQIDALQTQIEEIRNNGNYADYPKQCKTILRKYSEFPKKFNKIYKNQEVREVTDANGNTWYEVDVPKDIRKRERVYGIAGTAIAGGTAAAKLKPLKRNK